MSVIALAALVAAMEAPRVGSIQKAVLGFNDCSPVLFVVLPTNELIFSVSQIKYDEFGRLTGFAEDFAVANGPSMRAEVSVPAAPEGKCAAKYRAVIDGHERESLAEEEFKTDGLIGHIGFAAKDIGGVVVIGTLEGEFKTEFSYDAHGRRQLARQSFSLGRREYEVTYSDVAFDKFGRLAGYRARLKSSPKE